MLGKLIKHDLKTLSRYLIPLHAAILFLSLIGRLFVTGSADWSEPSPLLIIYSAGFCFILVTASSCTSILIAVYYYRNLFSKHGYLSWTIPASSGQHLASKTITGSIWMLFDYIIVLGSTVLFIYVPGIPWDELSALFTEEMGISFYSFFANISLVGLFGCFCGVMTYYAAIALGQLFSSHRVLGAVAVYCAINFLIQIFTMIVLYTGSNPFLPLLQVTNSWGSQFTQILWMSGIASLIEGIVFYVITYFIMNKKLNLS